jgi:hypothetical protein
LRRLTGEETDEQQRAEFDILEADCSASVCARYVCKKG